MPILSVFAPLSKSHYFVIYYRCVTGQAGARCCVTEVTAGRGFTPAAMCDTIQKTAGDCHSCRAASQ